MQTTTTTAAKAPKQFTFGVTEKHKKELGELRKDFTRPAAVAKAPPVAMSEKELIEVLYKVASDRRFKVEIKKDENGADIYDADGILETETIDLFEKEWEAIKVRDYSEQVSKTPTIEGLVAQIRKYGAALDLSAEMIQSMIDNALAAQPKAVEEPAAQEEEAAAPVEA
jgi:sulfur relay (sulfurtransferase) DsrC/TusE family protein